MRKLALLLSVTLLSTVCFGGFASAASRASGTRGVARLAASTLGRSRGVSPVARSISVASRPAANSLQSTADLYGALFQMTPVGYWTNVVAQNWAMALSMSGALPFSSPVSPLFY